MRINIAASHRFHLLDLARELSNLGHDVRFYSYVPTSRAIKFGLKRECSYSLLFLMLPFLAFIKITKGAYWSIRLSQLAMDYYLCKLMRPCDIYIALGTVYEKSFIAAKQNFNAVTILEWGSKHIEEQQRILSKIQGLALQNKYFIKRSLNGYKLADYISIPSDHVKQSFLAKGVPETKLLQNPYGVDLSMFMSTELVKEQPYDLIMVGGWSHRKGCDLLSSICLKANLRLLHVGPIVDLEFPKNKNMTHVDPVDQSRLIQYYEKAKVFVLPSREEGLAMVQSQALMCGLPIVCSMHTGGRDLRNLLVDKRWICEMQEYTIKELENKLLEALDLASTQISLRSYVNGEVDHLSWAAYGKRYNEKLKSICN
jgi:glycosyltransferase involved in cell wall biosynthesis